MSQGRNSGPALGMLPPDLKPMFDPRPPLLWKPPINKRVAPYVTGLVKYKDVFEKIPPPPIIPYETPKQRHARLREAKIRENEAKIEREIKKWNPKKDPNATGDAYKTLFVANMSYDTSEKKLRREFEQYGQIKKIRLVNDLEDQPRGYAFIEYEREEDMHMAYKKADGRKVDSRRLLVDVERGRTVRNWRPRRFGGGLGESRKTKPKKGEEKLVLEEVRMREEEKRKEEERRREDERRKELDREREREAERRSRGGSRDRFRESSRYGEARYKESRYGRGKRSRSKERMGSEKRRRGDSRGR